MYDNLAMASLGVFLAYIMIARVILPTLKRLYASVARNVAYIRGFKLVHSSDIATLYRRIESLETQLNARVVYDYEPVRVTRHSTLYQHSFSPMYDDSEEQMIFVQYPNGDYDYIPYSAVRSRYDN